MVSLPTPKCPGVTQGSPGVVWLVLGPHHGDSHTQGRRCGGRATKDGLGVQGDAMGVPGDTMGVPGVAMDDPRVAMGVPVGWS